MEFIDKIVPGAIKAYKEYGVLPSLTLAQAILESNWGKSGLSTKSNNLFGIKWTASRGGAYDEYDTKEFVNGKWITVKAKFRKYSSWEESVLDHAVLLTLSRYKPVLAAKNYKEACTQVQKCGYATDPAYTQKLIGIIEKYGLNKYDEVKDMTYEQALKCLASKFGISYDYWVGKKNIDKYFDDLIIKIAEGVKG